VTNLDAVAIDPASGTLYELGFREGTRTNVLDLLGSPPTDGVAAIAQAVHLVLLIRKYGSRFAVSPRVWWQLRAILRRSHLPDVRAMLIRKVVERGEPQFQSRIHACDEIIRRALEYGDVHVALAH